MFRESAFAVSVCKIFVAYLVYNAWSCAAPVVIIIVGGGGGNSSEDQAGSEHLVDKYGFYPYACVLWSLILICYINMCTDHDISV